MSHETVCIAFLGFDSDRIYLPFRDCGATKLYIIKRHRKDDKVAEYNFNLIKRNVPRGCIRVKVVEHDVFLRVNCLKQIFEEEKDNPIYVNVSTGSKL